MRSCCLIDSHCIYWIYFCWNRLQFRWNFSYSLRKKHICEIIIFSFNHENWRIPWIPILQIKWDTYFEYYHSFRAKSSYLNFLWIETAPSSMCCCLVDWRTFISVLNKNVRAIEINLLVKSEKSHIFNLVWIQKEKNSGEKMWS